MTKKDKRIAIAKDVLKRLRANKLNVECLVYLEGRLPGPMDAKDQAQDHIDDIEQNCDVCALGGMMLSHIRLYNKFTVNEILNSSKNIYVGRDSIEKQLGKYFSAHQLGLIESAFECADFYDYTPSVRKAINFGDRYPSPRKRLAAIMRNIVKNDGKFKP